MEEVVVGGSDDDEPLVEQVEHVVGHGPIEEHHRARGHRMTERLSEGASLRASEAIDSFERGPAGTVFGRWCTDGTWIASHIVKVHQ